MSRIILSKYPDNSDHVVIGWDHPARGAFWQEWATRQEVAEAEKQLASWEDKDPGLDSAEMIAIETLANTGVKREGGMWPGIPLDKFRESVPEDLRPLVTDEVMQLLRRHAEDPDSGFISNPYSVTNLSKE